MIANVYAQYNQEGYRRAFLYPKSKVSAMSPPTPTLQKFPRTNIMSPYTESRY
jgi:hypothetical protein